MRHQREFRMNPDQAILNKHRLHLEEIEAELALSVGSRVAKIEEISRHTLLGGGKRLRPLLFVLSCGLLGSRVQECYRLAGIFEIIHAASLLHDDVLDNAETRRSRPSANRLWGNHAAVLVGDFLYSKAFAVAFETGHRPFLQRLTETTTRMAEGQVLELEHTFDWDIGKEAYLEIVKAKTAVLISAACECGAILSGAGETAESALAQFGFHMGVAFQLMDDLLDYTAEEKVFGKPVVKDLREGKITLPLIYALADLEEADRAALRTRLTPEGAFPSEADFLQVLEMVRTGGCLERVREEASESVERAAGCLAIFPDSPAKRDLLQMNRYILDRSY